MAEILIDEEFRALLAPLSAEQYEGLEADILAKGCLDAIKLWNGTIIDGHNRYSICTKHDLLFRTEELAFDTRDDVIEWMIRNQLNRRNQTPEQISYFRGKLYEQRKKAHGGDRKSSYQNDNLKTSEKIAEEYGVSAPTIHRDADFAKAIDTIGAEAGQEVKQQILAGDLPITKKDVVTLAKMEPEERKDTITKLASGEAKSMRDAGRLQRKAKITEAPVMPTGKYRVIYADPPWKYGDGLTENYGGTQYHYPSMSIADLCAMPIKDIAEDDAVLFLWVTSPLLEECFEVIRAWGFKYKTSFVWDKIRHNMGHYNSVRHEFLLICTRGSCTPDVSQLFDSVQSIERSNRHSEKPEEFRSIIETLYTHGQRLELFARAPHDGWEVYGNQL